MKEYKRRIDEHDFMLFKFQQRTQMELEYERRINNLQKDVKLFTEEQKGKMDKVLDLFDLISSAESENKGELSLIKNTIDTQFTAVKTDIQVL